MSFGINPLTVQNDATRAVCAGATTPPAPAATACPTAAKSSTTVARAAAAAVAVLCFLSSLVPGSSAWAISLKSPGLHHSIARPPCASACSLDLEARGLSFQLICVH